MQLEGKHRWRILGGVACGALAGIATITDRIAAPAEHISGAKSPPTPDRTVARAFQGGAPTSRLSAPAADRAISDGSPNAFTPEPGDARIEVPAVITAPPLAVEPEARLAIANSTSVEKAGGWGDAAPSSAPPLAIAPVAAIAPEAPSAIHQNSPPESHRGQQDLAPVTEIKVLEGADPLGADEEGIGFAYEITEEMTGGKGQGDLARPAHAAESLTTSSLDLHVVEDSPPSQYGRAPRPALVGPVEVTVLASRDMSASEGGALPLLEPKEGATQTFTDTVPRQHHIVQTTRPKRLSASQPVATSVIVPAAMRRLSTRSVEIDQITSPDRSVHIAQIGSAVPKAQMAVRYDGRAIGLVGFQVDAESKISVNVGQILDLFKTQFKMVEFARLRNAKASSEFVTLERLVASGIPVVYDPVYDELVVRRAVAG